MGKNDEKKNVTTDPNSASFDFSKYLPEGYDSKDLRKIDGLTPIYSAEYALDQVWPPAVGWMDRIITIDMGEEQTPNNRFREFILMQTTTPTKGIRGDKRNREVVDIGQGEDLLVPMSGNIKNISVLRAALADNEKVYIGAFRVVGKMDVGQPTDMWKVDSFLHPKSDIRKGRFLLGMNEKHAPELVTPPGGGVTSTGAIHTRDGEVIGQKIQARA